MNLIHPPYDERQKNAADWFVKLAMGAAAVGAIILVGFLASLAFQFDVALKGGIKLEETGQVGDFIGGIVGSFWALAGVLLFYSALNLQRQEFDLQRRELKSQRQEIAVTRITDTIYRQLEIVDSAERKLSLNFDPRASRQVTLDGKELLDAIVNGGKIRYSSRKFRNVRKKQ